MSNTVVNTNVLALNSHRALKTVGNMQSSASEKLSTGERINKAADDAAGLAISEKMRSQIRGLDQASRNAQDGISMVQTAEGGLTEMGEMVQRVRELVVQSSNDSNTDSDRAKIDKEIAHLGEEIGAMAERVEFNTKTLLDGGLGSQSFQIGANAGQSITVGFSTDFKTDIGDVIKAIQTSGSDSATISSEIVNLDAHLETINNQRADFGAVQNRLEYTINSLNVSSENLSASESRIRDTDMAKEMMNLTKANVLQQAATNMLGQANQAPQNILSLLR